MTQKVKKSWKKFFAEWAITIAAGIAILYFFAPSSWWQFGVFPYEKRKSGADFTLKTFDGKETWNFADKRGKVLVVNYWATWCSPCRIETPGLVNTANFYHDELVEFIGVTVDDELDLVPPFIEKYKISYQILLPGYDPNLTDDNIALPTTFLYDKNGKLAKKYTGIVLESTLKSDIDELLKES